MTSGTDDAASFERKKHMIDSDLLHEEKLRTIVEALPVAVSWADRQGTTEYVNRKFRELFGYTLEDIPTISDWFRKAYPDASYRDYVVSAWQQAVDDNSRQDGSEIEQMDVRVTCKDGTIRDVVIKTALIADRLLAIFDDLTEARRTQEALQESEARFRHVFNGAQDGMLVADNQTHRFCLANASILDMLGYTEDEILTLSVSDIHPQAALEKVIAYFERQARGEIRIAPNLPVLRKNGELFYADISSGPIVLNGRECLIGIFRDATERKQFEEAIIRERDFSNTALNSMPGIFYMFDQSGRFLRWNRNFEIVTGYTSEEIRRMTPLDLFQGADKHHIQERIQEVFEKGYSHAEANFISKDGKTAPFYFTGVRTHVDEKPCIIGMGIDITERKQAEETLRQSETNYRALINASYEMMAVLDEAGRFLFINPRASRWLGKTPEEVIHRHALEIIAEQPIDEGLAAIRRTIRNGRSESTETSIMIAGQKRHIGLTCIPIVYGGIPAALIITTDITEQQRHQEQLRQAEKMQALGQLAGGIAHDFNNQLTAILGYAEILVGRLDDENMRRHAEMITRAATRSADLTRQLLAFARKGKYQAVPVEMHGIIGEVVALLYRSIDKRITIKQMLTAHPSTTIGDPNQLQNAFLNLAINGRDAMSDGGELIFTTTAVHLNDSDCRKIPFEITPGHYIKVSVGDTGMGMNPETMNHIFEPFFTTKRIGEGTGMGLAAVYGTIKNHKGAITVTSEIGQGSRFDVYLPLTEAAVVMESQDTVKEASAAEAAHILVVDDEEMVRNVADDILQSLGYQVSLCKDGKEAVNFYQREWKKIDLIILDLVMPRLSGRETFTALRGINPSARILLSSGYSIDGQAQTLIEEGALDFVQKPYRIKNLMITVAAALGR